MNEWQKRILQRNARRDAEILGLDAVYGYTGPADETSQLGGINEEGFYRARNPNLPTPSPQTSPFQKAPQQNMAAAAGAQAAGQVGSSFLGGLFDLIGNTQKNNFTQEQMKIAQEYNLTNMGKINEYEKGYIDQRFKNNSALSAQSFEQSTKFNLQSADLNLRNQKAMVGMQSSALESMGLPGGAWALGSLSSNLPRTTQMVNQGSYARSALPGDPTTARLNGSTIQQQFGWGNYIS
nr:MAG: hypothetical protein [Wufeng shrew picorna-like virus 43]